MRRAYLYDQDAKEADHMNAGEPFIDMPTTQRGALNDLINKGGLDGGDTLVVTAKSKLGHGQGAARIERQLTGMAVALEISPSPLKPTNLRRKKRGPKPDQLAYLSGIWASTLAPDAAIAQASRYMGFPVDRNWLNYHVCKRDGGVSTKKQKEAET